MGQYYYVVNLDKKEILHPHKMGDGLKLMELGTSSLGTLTGLAILLADGNGRGGGDINSEDPIIGSWAGDRIVIAGDYADYGRFIKKKDCEGLQAKDGTPVNHQKINLHALAANSYRDISYDVLFAMLDDKSLSNRRQQRGESEVLKDFILIKNTAEGDLPTILHDMKTDEGKTFLAKRLKNMKAAA